MFNYYVITLFVIAFVAIIIFILSYYAITKKNLYSYLVISMTFLQLLMADGLTRYLEFSIILTTIGLISYRNIPQGTLKQDSYEKIS